MKETIIKQHRYKTGSVKKLVEQRNEDTTEIIGYAAIFKTGDNIILDCQVAKNLPDCRGFYIAMQINHCNEKFMNKRGRLTRYALACGYIEHEDNILGSYKNLYQDSACIHVHSRKHTETDKTWETFNMNELTKARKFYASISL